MKPRNKIKTVWTPNLAYCVGLIASDGSLSIDGRHINFTSKDIDLVKIFANCLGATNTIGSKASGSSREKRYYQIQIGDVGFYRFLQNIGLTPNKSKTLADLAIPAEYFFDFLRGHFDGDGSFYSYYDPRWKDSFMFYTVFISASANHISWLRSQISHAIGINGHVNQRNQGRCYQLKYAKRESLILMENLYYRPGLPCLERKLLKIRRVLSIINQRKGNPYARVV